MGFRLLSSKYQVDSRIIKSAYYVWHEQNLRSWFTDKLTTSTARSKLPARSWIIVDALCGEYVGWSSLDHAYSRDFVIMEIFNWLLWLGLKDEFVEWPRLRLGATGPGWSAISVLTNQESLFFALLCLWRWKFDWLPEASRYLSAFETRP
jgi:hypothetical protein